uniref:(northern house mosquito) hypothetical protein n=1 Tax=Culex pipiens TaxID=7175 RepID=A0A8D8BC65_CULPI
MHLFSQKHPPTNRESNRQQIQGKLHIDNGQHFVVCTVHPPDLLPVPQRNVVVHLGNPVVDESTVEHPQQHAVDSLEQHRMPRDDVGQVVGSRTLGDHVQLVGAQVDGVV